MAISSSRINKFAGVSLRMAGITSSTSSSSMSSKTDSFLVSSRPTRPKLTNKSIRFKFHYFSLKFSFDKFAGASQQKRSCLLNPFCMENFFISG